MSATETFTTHFIRTGKGPYGEYVQVRHNGKSVFINRDQVERMETQENGKVVITIPHHLYMKKFEPHNG